MLRRPRLQLGSLVRPAEVPWRSHLEVGEVVRQVVGEGRCQAVEVLRRSRPIERNRSTLVSAWIWRRERVLTVIALYCANWICAWCSSICC